MIVPGSASPLLTTTDGGYTIAKSLRFRASASAYIARTPSSTGNQQKWTWSGWVKRGYLGDLAKVLAAYNNSGNSIFAARFESNNTLNIYSYNTATDAYIWQVQTTQVFRDPSAWFHLVIAIDTTQSTASNRVKLYVNGSQVTAFGTSNYPSQNTNTELNANGYSMQIGTGTANNSSYSQFFDGYLADTYMIDGQQLTPSSFGETDATTGVWKPKAYSGTYGTNGFYLKFTDVATTSGSNAGLGKDFSGNGNYWTTNNISVTSGSTYDSMKDVPTLTDTDTANYAVMNPLASGGTLSNGNLTYNTGTNNTGFATFSMSSGKWYWEYTVTTIAGGTPYNGIIDSTLSQSPSVGGAWGSQARAYRSDGTKYDGSSSTSYGATYTSGDVIGTALDVDAGTLTFYKNGTSQGTAFSSGISGKTWFPMMYGQETVEMNFGQRPFAYTPPTGYKALNTYNLPDSTIVAGNKVMDATTYTGNGSTQSITNAGGFKPDLVWMKGRNYVVNHVLNDSVRGISKFLFSDSTSAELTNTGYGVTSFNSNGFTAVDDSTGNYGSNGSSKTYVGWQWQAGQGTTSSNTNGSITSTVSVNASAGFSIVTFNNATSGNYTVGHGLGVAPKLIIIKYRSGTSNWFVYHESIGYANRLLLNTTGASASATYWTAAPSSTVINFGSSFADNPSQSLVAYCWAEIAGFSKFDSYTGNGSADGVFVYTGFRPKWIMIKNTTTAGTYWFINDSSRNTYNPTGLNLGANASDAEGNDAPVFDFLSNGFKLRCTYGSFNTNGNTMIYAAFAENPFKNALAR